MQDDSMEVASVAGGYYFNEAWRAQVHRSQFRRHRKVVVESGRKGVAIGPP